MAHDMPLIRDGVLMLHDAHHDTAIPVDSSAWRAWLAEEEVTRFRFETGAASFTARRERVPGGLYWYAYRRQQGKLRKAYLGRSDDVTLARLHAVCAQLAAQPVPDAELPPAASSPISTQPTHLLATKLYIPSVRPQAVLRPRLMAQLETGLAGKLTLIAAPAGFGKTTLLATWLRPNDERGTMNDEELEAPFHRSSFIAHRFKVAW